jgi:Tol biopolymer transport system component
MFKGTEDEADLWVRPILGGTPRRLGNLQTGFISFGGAWSPDGASIVYTHGSELRLARSDGTESRPLVTAEGAPFTPRWSPDGTRIRYSVRDTQTGALALWEVDARGGNPKNVLQGWKGPSACCGNWTADGRQFVFTAGGDLWALRESRGLLGARRTEPVQLTFGPLRFGRPVPSRDGKRLFAIGQQEQGELVRFDAGSGLFVPYLSSLSAWGVAFSKDTKWVAYVGYPDGSLWRSRVDGTERLQLTFPPFRAACPRWSPDGTQIAVYGGPVSEHVKVYTIPAAGGAPRRATKREAAEFDPSWSADGRSLLFGTGPWQVASTSPEAVIHVLDLATGDVSDLPGSQGLFDPRFSPDGRHVVALSFDRLKLMLLDVGRGEWTELYRGTAGWSSWSRDGGHVYFDAGSEVRRVRIADKKVEVVASLKGVGRPPGWGTWVGLALDDSPMVLRDVGTHEIYGLDFEAP